MFVLEFIAFQSIFTFNLLKLNNSEFFNVKNIYYCIKTIVRQLATFRPKICQVEEHRKLKRIGRLGANRPVL